MTQQKSAHNLDYMPHIDGLRAVAVFIILLFHLDVRIVGGGFIGVDIFFVISGYLITKIIKAQMEEGRFSFSTFYARRIKRIFPALFAMLFVTTIAAILFLGLTEYTDFLKSMRMASVQISNIFFSHEVDYFAKGHDLSPLLHTWSLGIEEQFYLIWPALLLLIFKFKGEKLKIGLFVAIFVGSLLVSEYLVRHDAMAAFYLLHSRAWEFALGGVLNFQCGAFKPKKMFLDVLSYGGFWVVILSAIFLKNADFPGLKAFIPTLGAASIIYSCERGQSHVKKLLSLRPVVFVGLMSYSIYLWHWPLIAFYKEYFSNDLSMVVKASIVAITLLISLVSYRYIEMPFRKFKISSSKTIAIGLCVVVFFVLSSNVLKKFGDANWRVTYSMDEYARRPHALDKVCSIDDGAFDKENCIIGANKDKYEVILVGDSHASHYTPAVLAWAKGRGLTTRIFLRGACPAWIDTNKVRIKAGKVDTYCMNLTKAFYDTLEKDKSIRFVILGKSGPRDDKETRESLLKIKSFHKNIIFLGQPPVFKENPHECQIKKSVLASHIFPRADMDKNCLALDLPWSLKQQTESRMEILALSKDLSIPYFDPYPFMQSAFDEQGRFMYLDDNHINRYGGEHLALYLAKFIDAQKF